MSSYRHKDNDKLMKAARNEVHPGHQENFLNPQVVQQRNRRLRDMVGSPGIFVFKRTENGHLSEMLQCILHSAGD